MLTVSGKFQHGWVVGAGDRQEGDFKFLKRDVGMHQAKLWATQVLTLAKMKGNYIRQIYSTPQSCAATHIGLIAHVSRFSFSS